MKASVILGLLVTFLAASGCSHLEPVHDSVAVIDFERQEDNGFVNIVPCRVVLSDHQKISLSGGERATVSVSPGRIDVIAYSIDPYAPHSRATAWRSPRTTLQISAGERLRVRVAPSATDSTYDGGWVIRAAKPAAGQRRSSLLAGFGRRWPGVPERGRCHAHLQDSHFWFSRRLCSARVASITATLHLQSRSPVREEF
jgi:hypothetical protein